MNDKQEMMREAYYDAYGKTERLIEKWSDRVGIVNEVNGKPMTHDQELVLAQCLENTQDAISMLEATDARDTDGFKHFALDLVTAVVPNLVANDLVSVQPIDNRVGVINYIRYIYGSSKGVVNSGDEFASGYRVAA